MQMSKKIEDLEKAALGEKPWQLSGEVTAQARPENSMLEEDVEFEQTSRSGTRLLLCISQESDQRAVKVLSIT